jgi:hypothetical protein
MRVCDRDRRIEAGTMNLDLEYKVDHSELQGENKVILEGLKLGERRESRRDEAAARPRHRHPD